MKITKKSQAINKIRPDGSDITYYIFPEYEVHHGIIAPGVVQPWHHHQTINESLIIISGKVVLHYLDNDLKKERIVGRGDLVQVEDTPHTFSNPFDEECEMAAFRFVPQNIDQREIIKNDKVLDKDLD